MRNHTKHHGTKEFCMYCLQAFGTKEVLAKRKENCLSINGKQGIQMPKKGSKVQFQDHHRQMPAPFVVYADFEAISQKKYLAANQVQKSHLQKNISSIQHVVMVIN